MDGRPCFYCFEMEGYFWMVLISSKTEKYRALYEEKKKRYKEYDDHEIREKVRHGDQPGRYEAYRPGCVRSGRKSMRVRGAIMRWL